MTTTDLHSANILSHAEALLEIGKLNADRGDFFIAIEKLEMASTLFHKEKKFDQYLKSTNILLRMYAETDNQEKVTSLKDKLQDLVLKEGLALNARTYYTLALFAEYRGQYESAMEYLKKSLELGLSANNKEDICYAVYGTAGVLRKLGRYDEALKVYDKATELKLDSS